MTLVRAKILRCQPPTVSLKSPFPGSAPYCHEGIVGYGYDGYYNGYPMLSISCPVCESESTRDYD